jgi:hypothetical protein
MHCWEGFNSQSMLGEALCEVIINCGCADMGWLDCVLLFSPSGGDDNRQKTHYTG